MSLTKATRQVMNYMRIGISFRSTEILYHFVQSLQITLIFGEEGIRIVLWCRYVQWSRECKLMPAITGYAARHCGSTGAAVGHPAK